MPILAAATAIHTTPIIILTNYSWDVEVDTVSYIKIEEIKTEPFYGTIMFFGGTTDFRKTLAN